LFALVFAIDNGRGMKLQPPNWPAK